MALDTMLPLGHLADLYNREEIMARRIMSTRARVGAIYIRHLAEAQANTVCCSRIRPHAQHYRRFGQTHLRNAGRCVTNVVARGLLG